MKTIVIGHRGVGKSTLMERLMASMHERQILCFDLDDEIEKKIGKKISDFFVEHGEAYFREVEKQVFLEFIQKINQDCYIFAGAGFDVASIPENIEVLWVRRKTDSEGRIFLNRPRLDRDLSPLQEYQKRFLEREKKFQIAATRIYEMPEGNFQNKIFANTLEKQIVMNEVQSVGGILTLMPEHFKNDFTWSCFKNRYLYKNIFAFEIRDDLVPFELFHQIFQDLINEKIILSIRKTTQFQNYRSYFAKCEYVDWAIELGPVEEIAVVPEIKKIILSQHQDSVVALEEAAAHAEKIRSEVYLKWSPEVENFQKISTGLQWQKQNPQKFSFLPRSFNGRWQWVRQYLKNKQVINFWREGAGSALDQPTLFHWLATPTESFVHFAAVVGDPIHHSYSPLEHLDYFHELRMPFFAIQIAQNEWDLAIEVLQKWGLKFVAVTSPHKENAAKLLAHPQLTAVNTLFAVNEVSWKGCGTDVLGFKELIDGIEILAPLQSQIVIWGGGGVLPTIQEVLPNARYFSARTGYLRGEDRISGFQSDNPVILVWAAPRTEFTLFPPLDWKPQLIIDLNYKEDSMGKEYAFLTGCHYLSGEKMFSVQAQAQRKFWTKELQK